MAEKRQEAKGAEGAKFVGDAISTQPSSSHWLISTKLVPDTFYNSRKTLGVPQNSRGDFRAMA